MELNSRRIYTLLLDGVALIGAGVYLVAALVESRASLMSPDLLLLALGMGAVGWVARRLKGADPASLAPSLILAALVALPTPSALILLGCALLSGRGAGVLAGHRSGRRAIASLTVSVALCEALASTLPVLSEGHTAMLLARLFALWIVFTAVAHGWSSLHSGAARLDWSSVSQEVLNLPVAMLTVGFIHSGNGVGLAGIAMIAVGGSGILRSLFVKRRELQRVRHALSARASELETLQAIGREIVSSSRPDRVFAILERECRKIFDFDCILVALAERGGGPFVATYRHRRRQPPEQHAAVGVEGLTRLTLESMRPRRFDDIDSAARRADWEGDWIAPGVRSMLLVPLIVDGNVVGVITLQSEQKANYDDHQLGVMTTIAQQVAIVVENARHYQAATVDSLTGFYVRDYFFSRLEEEDKRARRYGGGFALLMVDIDEFKEINDHNGHLAGDQYLRSISGTIRDQLRAADIVCRYGGDEFCLLLPQTGMTGARAIAERIRDAVSKDIVAVDGLALRTTVSIGLALFPDHDAGDLEGLMHKADEALYRAKRGGRDRVVPFAA